MKIKLLLLMAIGVFSFANAQYTIKDDAGNVLNNGDVIEFGVLSYPDASYDFFVTNNNTTNTIYSRVEYISETNALEEDFEQLCYGIQCYFGVPLGTTVPPAEDNAVVIEPGQTTGIGNHFYSDDPGNGIDNVDFVFTFRQYENETSNVEIGTPLTFTYRYNPSLGVNRNNKLKLNVLSTVVSNEIVLEVAEPLQMTMYNIQGKVVKQASFDNGRHTVNVSDLSAQAYILQFSNKAGGVQTTKILVK